MPPCILGASTRQLVIHLIYSAQTVGYQTVQLLLFLCLWAGVHVVQGTQQPLSFTSDLMVMSDSIKGQEKKIIHDFLSVASDSSFM